MKADIHPELYETTVVCSGCQTEFKTHSTREAFRIEICSNCHPFYTGKQSRIIDTEGRVEKFVKKFQDQQTRVSKRKRRIATRVAETTAQEEREKQKAIDEKTAREEARIRRREEQVALRATREAEEKTVADSRAAQVAAPETEAKSPETPPEAATEPAPKAQAFSGDAETS